MLDFITIVPGIVSVASAEYTLDTQAWTVARTLRVFRIFRCGAATLARVEQRRAATPRRRLRCRRVLRMLRVVTLGPGSSLQRQIAILAVTVLSMVFCAAGIYQVRATAGVQGRESTQEASPPAALARSRRARPTSSSPSTARSCT